MEETDGASQNIPHKLHPFQFTAKQQPTPPKTQNVAVNQGRRLLRCYLPEAAHRKLPAILMPLICSHLFPGTYWIMCWVSDYIGKKGRRAASEQKGREAEPV